MGVFSSPCLYVCPSMFVHIQFEKCRNILITFYIGEFYYNIQDDSGGICITLGNYSMSDSKQKVHTNMGPILNGYGVIGIF